MEELRRKLDAEKLRRQHAEEQRDLWESKFRGAARKVQQEQHGREVAAKRGDLRHQLSEAILGCSKVEAENVALRQRNQRLETELAEAKSIENSLRKELEIWKLSEALRDPERLRAAETIVSVQWLTHENLKLRRELQVSADGAHQQQQQASASQTAVLELRQQLRDMEHVLRDEQLLNSRLTNQANAQVEHEFALRQQVERIDLQNQQQQSEIDLVRRELRVQTEGKQVSEQEVVEFKCEIQRLQGWLQEERRMGEAKQAEIEKLQKLVGEMEATRKNDEAQLFQFEANQKPLQKEVSILLERLHFTQKELFECREELTEAEETIRASRGSLTSIAAANEEIGSLANRVKQLESELAASLSAVSASQRSKVDLEQRQLDEQREHDESEKALLGRLDRVKFQADSVAKENMSLARQVDLLQKENSRFQLLLSHHSKLSATARTMALHAKVTPIFNESYDFALSPETPHPR